MNQWGSHPTSNYDRDNVLDEHIQDITKTGVEVDLRARMHEKFAIIDKSVLWHGSLNIFSHRNTSESMLRIPSQSACKQIAQFVSSSLHQAREDRDTDIDLTEKENPACPNCSKPMVWKNGRYGIYFECEQCGSKIDTRRSTRRHRTGKTKGTNKTKSKACPECGRSMKQRRGRFGPFWGCTGYPKCKYTEGV